jgi:ABC-2 type transport system ATP-binding protein
LGVLEADQDITGDIAGVAKVKEVKVVKPGEYRIKAECGEEAAPRVIDAVRAKGYHVNRISLTKPTLDQVYLELTGKLLREESADRMQVRLQRRTMRTARS